MGSSVKISSSTISAAELRRSGGAGVVLVILLALGWLYHTASTPTATPQYTLNGRTMGTTYSVKFQSLPDKLSPDAVQTGIDTLLTEVNRVMSTYDPNSELSRFNRSTATDWTPVSAELYQVVAAAQAISRLSGGAFDITVGPLVNLWGFGPTKPATDAVPAVADIAAAQALTGYSKLHLQAEPPALKKDLPGLYVDLSAIAKGYGVDRVAQYLDSLGIRDYLVEIGGELRASGVNAEGKPWALAIEKPTPGARAVEQIIRVSDRGVATSGDYRNFFVVAGQQYSHAIDPHTGWPVAHELASVTVVSDTCREADAWATTLLVLGPERGAQLAEAQGLAAFFIVIDGDRLVERHTPAFAPYLAGEDLP